MRATSRSQVVEPLSALIGREAARARLEQLITGERRLVTLLGPAGIGKTRLVLALASRLRSRFDGAIIFCDLSEARSTPQLCAVVSAAIADEPSASDDPVAAIGRQLAAAGELLVILDGAEQLADATAAAVSSWLGAAPDLRCLVTSRLRLQLAGEAAYELEPLSEAAAVELFVERAREARDGFALRDGERAAVAEIAARLDGVPLALELAAAQTVVQRPSALLAALDDRLALLDAGLRGAPARHASLRAALDGSWQLLDARERSVLAQCSAFRGAFSLQAAEPIVEIDRTGPPLINLLRRLCDHSLLRRSAPADAPDRAAFQLLSTIRGYAREQLDARGDGAEVLARHARFHLAAAPIPVELQAVAERGLRASAASGVTIEDALRALCALADAAPDAGVHAQLDRALAAAAGADSGLVARARASRGRLRLHDGQWAQARDDFQAAIDGATDPSVRAAACCGLGHVFRRQGQRGAAEQAYLRALGHHGERADRHGQAQVLASLGGLLHEQGAIAPARELHEQALALYRELGDERGAAVVLQNAGLIIQEQGQLEEAEAIFREAHKLHVALGHRRFEGIALFDLAGVHFERGLLTRARADAERAIEVLRAAGDRRQAALALAIRGACSAALGRLDDARQALDQADAQLAVIDDRTFAHVVEVHRGHLDLALALRAYAGGADGTCATHLAAAARRARPPRRTRRRPDPRSSECDELRLAARILRAAVERHRDLGASLFVAGDQSWLRGPGAERAEVASRKVLRRILAALVERRLTAPLSPLSRVELVRCGWPDERVATAPAINRLQVAITQLRKLGLERALIRRGDGYLIDPEVSLFVLDAAA